MKLGFLGSENGIQPSQFIPIGAILDAISPYEVIHGGTNQSDIDFHRLARVRCSEFLRITICPSKGSRIRSSQNLGGKWLEPVDKKAQIEYIINHSDELIIAPRHDIQEEDLLFAAMAVTISRDKQVSVAFPSGRLVIVDRDGHNEWNHLFAKQPSEPISVALERRRESL